MPIIPRPQASVKPRRPHRVFGEGLIEPRVRDLSSDWRSDVSDWMRGQRYTPAAIGDALEWLRVHGTAVGCPAIDDEDRAAVSELYDAHTSQDLRHAAPGRVPAEPRGPSPADRAWLCDRDARSVVARSMIDPATAEAIAAGRRSPAPAARESVSDLLARQSGLHLNLLDMVREGLDRSSEYRQLFAELGELNREIARATGRPFFG